jgi:DNA polymerase III alpha subunit
VLDMPFADVERITKLVPNTLNITLEEALREEPCAEEGYARKIRRSRAARTSRCGSKAWRATARCTPPAS